MVGSGWIGLDGSQTAAVAAAPSQPVQEALGGPVELIVVPGKGHEAIPAYFEVPRMVEFLKVGEFPLKADAGR